LLSAKIPLYPRLFQLGHFAIPTYGAFTALALVAALAALMHFARRLNLDANKIWNLGLIGILTTLVIARLLLVTAYFSAFRRHPFWILGLTANRSTWIDTVAVCLGFAGAILYALAEGLPILRMLDCIAPAAALALVLNRTGAFLSGVDYGLPAAHGWSIVYTSRIAPFWYRTPLGVRLYPVQLYQAIASLAILGILAGWLPRRTQDGELWGAWLFLSGVSSFFLNFYRPPAQSQWVIPQPVAVAMVIASAAFLLRRKSGGYTVENDSSHI
jgi:phosphatidylglycerol:prolipoprotein diacylglycerol transferase